MDGGYNFWADLLATYRYTSDLVKVGAIAILALTVICLFAYYLDYRLRKYRLSDAGESLLERGLFLQLKRIEPDTAIDVDGPHRAHILPEDEVRRLGD